jgi:hypothetical protein
MSSLTSSALGKSTLFKTGMISKSFSKAKYRFEIVWAYFVLHLQSKCPSQAAIDRETSYEKSTWQEYQSFRMYSSPCKYIPLHDFYRDTTFSFQIHAVKQLCFSSRAVTVCVLQVNGQQVFLPWSICAIMQKFLYVSYSFVNFIKELSCVNLRSCLLQLMRFLLQS